MMTELANEVQSRFFGPNFLLSTDRAVGSGELPRHDGSAAAK